VSRPGLRNGSVFGARDHPQKTQVLQVLHLCKKVAGPLQRMLRGAMFRPIMAKLRDIKVVLRTPDGHYLAGGPVEWDFTDDLGEAAVFNYLADEIETQIAAIEKSNGLALEAVHVEAHELCETCDRCREIVLPTIAFFDGKRFLCPDCNRETKTAVPAAGHWRA
jgi:hypothetical protein